MALVIGTPTTSGRREWLTRISAAQDVDGFDSSPVDPGDVAEVGYVWVVAGEDACRGVVDLGEPCGRRSEVGVDGHVEAGVPGEQ